MEKKAVEIENLNVDELLKKLNGALADEWLSNYQYWLGAQLVEEPMKNEIEQKLLQYAEHEYHHATLVIGRILQLGGTPILDPREWFDNAKFETPSDSSLETILGQVLEREMSSIQMYEDIAEMTDGKEHATHQMATFILNEEREHERQIKEEIEKLEGSSKEFPLGV